MAGFDFNASSPQAEGSVGTSRNPQEQLKNLLEIRRPIYLDLADLAVKTDRRVARKLAADIINQLPDHLK